ncbi:MAG: esterase family protein [Bacteroidaceae bacterium]|nr:esterase family protein [Bacteroidaceae bacterium]
MKKTLFIACFLLASVVGMQARVVTDSINSKVLGATVKFNVWLPWGFEQNTDATYPVLYLLHGFTDTYSAWVEKGRVDEIADELLGTGEISPMLIVMPNAGGPDTRNVWNGYFDMDGWAYETFFFTEFLPFVESKYRIVGDRQHRAVSGLSMGGGGSTVYAQRHPDMFSSCYAMSAWLDSGNEGIDPANKATYVMKAVGDHAAAAFVRNASDEQKAQLRTLRWFIDIGDDDFLLDQDLELYKEMRQARIPCELRVRNGGHTWEYWHVALRTSLPFASREFNK